MVKCLWNRCVFSCCLKVVMVSANWVEVGIPFYQRGTDRVKILVSDFVPLCEQTLRLCSFSDCKLLECIEVEVCGSSSSPESQCKSLKFDSDRNYQKIRRGVTSFLAD